MCKRAALLEQERFLHRLLGAVNPTQEEVDIKHNQAFFKYNVVKHARPQYTARRP